MPLHFLGIESPFILFPIQRIKFIDAFSTWLLSVQFPLNAVCTQSDCWVSGSWSQKCYFMSKRLWSRISTNSAHAKQLIQFSVKHGLNILRWIDSFTNCKSYQRHTRRKMRNNSAANMNETISIDDTTADAPKWRQQSNLWGCMTYSLLYWLYARVHFSLKCESFVGKKNIQVELNTYMVYNSIYPGFPSWILVLSSTRKVFCCEWARKFLEWQIK